MSSTVGTGFNWEGAFSQGHKTSPRSGYKTKPSVGLQNYEGDLYQRQSGIIASLKQVVREFAKLRLL